MNKDVALFLQSVAAVGTGDTVGTAIGQIWTAFDAAMPGSDFTEIWKYVAGD
jgi:Flp pilus assembly pilin Flp